MSRAQLRDAVIEERTKSNLTQVAAAAAWKVDIGLLVAIEDPKSQRNFGATTLAPLDKVLNESAFKLFKQTDDAAEARRAVAELTERVTELRGEVEALKERVTELLRGSTLELLLSRELADDERAEVTSYAHFVMSKRRSA